MIKEVRESKTSTHQIGFMLTKVQGVRRRKLKRYASKRRRIMLNKLDGDIMTKGGDA